MFFLILYFFYLNFFRCKQKNFHPITSLIDLKTFENLPLAQNVLCQINEYCACKQQKLQSRILTQLLEAQAKIYLRHKKKEIKRRKKNNKKKQHSLYDIESMFEYDCNNNTLEINKSNLECNNSKNFILSCLDRIGNLQISAQCLNRFHWISQVKYSIFMF